jgi:hypothetical protein
MLLQVHSIIILKENGCHHKVYSFINDHRVVIFGKQKEMTKLYKKRTNKTENLQHCK